MNKAESIVSVQTVELAAYGVNFQVYTDDSSSWSDISFWIKKFTVHKL